MHDCPDFPHECVHEGPNLNWTVYTGVDADLGSPGWSPLLVTVCEDDDDDDDSKWMDETSGDPTPQAYEEPPGCVLSS